MSKIIKFSLLAVILIVMYCMMWLASFKPNLNPWNGTADPDVDISQCEQPDNNCWFG